MTMSSMQRRAAPPPNADLPPYPEHHAASSISQQMATRAAHWGQTARGLRDEIAATEEALVAALDEQERREANRTRLREALNASTDRGLR
ncbi:hypothetical protein GCM10009840_27290 [Pseudolysinimonas kribbensis]|uniref:Uncharacterized protein n=1 Tax=Pseudolysinimonas kribbensis TaxID=433641 RepID=A0ABQ6K733_9MICO|nr:hypothetical protein [Pseudolysinimonas kribbensis]GMA96463.1 hypothetical protein GCM10025881_32870 [Pseudolysinimonas kribbensis]